MKKLILVTGGARSGKSSYALATAEDLSEKRLFVATCPHLDEEMSLRVERHKRERQNRGWQTVEEPTDLAHVFAEDAGSFDVVLIDCITLWVNNILYGSGEDNVDDYMIRDLCSLWLDSAANFTGVVICVTNEVGMGVVPENRLARKYRDLVGTCNQLLGEKADEVILVSCGLPLFLKKKKGRGTDCEFT
ncbi:MAG: bifunctional adenosylcobinamide kinase/adenosylcobinamide-phosphate guanylyltransferase [Deltaproteobacteria bacterium]|nr:bifunctional adenosylcobinamide kinase/adenosylcobinamide-phosphate guanylyltransferase [Deltaproteobacteria bacterium]